MPSKLFQHTNKRKGNRLASPAGHFSPELPPALFPSGSKQNPSETLDILRKEQRPFLTRNLLANNLTILATQHIHTKSQTTAMATSSSPPLQPALPKSYLFHPPTLTSTTHDIPDYDSDPDSDSDTSSLNSYASTSTYTLDVLSPLTFNDEKIYIYLHEWNRASYLHWRSEKDKREAGEARLFAIWKSRRRYRDLLNEQWKAGLWAGARRGRA